MADDMQHFLTGSAKVTKDAQLIIDAIPAVNLDAAEQTQRKLAAILLLLDHLEDKYITDTQKQEMKQYVQSLITPIQNHLLYASLSLDPRPSLSYTGRRGRPHCNLDLLRAQKLHYLGNPWEDIAKAMGVTGLTLYNHLKKAGLSTARQEYTVIDDDTLDGIISNITLEHLFI
ncbi:hypothetical protein FRC03_002844, partial [Tulasnella sp. 419]